MLRRLLLGALLVACSEEPHGVDYVVPDFGGGSALPGAAGTTSVAGQAGTAGTAPAEPIPVPPGDTCGDVVDVKEAGGQIADGTWVISGTNAGAATDFEHCESASAPLADVVYSFTPEATGGLHWTLDGVTPTRFLVDVRAECARSAATLQCDDCGVVCNNDLEVTAGETLYFIVFAARTSKSPSGTGIFDLTFKLNPNPALGEACTSPYLGGRYCPEGSTCQNAEGETSTCSARACGDGLLSFEPLECDDGNTDSGDGCSATCEADAQGAGGPSCDAPVTLNLPRTRAILDDSVFSYGVGSGDFAGGSDLDASCADAAGPEAVYVFELPVASKVDIAAQNADVLSVRRAGAADCGTEELACAMDATSLKPSLSLELEPGRYSVILDREEPTLATTPDYLFDLFVTTR